MLGNSATFPAFRFFLLHRKKDNRAIMATRTGIPTPRPIPRLLCEEEELLLTGGAVGSEVGPVVWDCGISFVGDVGGDVVGDVIGDVVEVEVDEDELVEELEVTPIVAAILIPFPLLQQLSALVPLLAQHQLPSSHSNSGTLSSDLAPS